jgi:aromatic-L-amino-acid/L-tryptophan decarboxylase
MQNSRGFRALKVWLALRHAGRSGYQRMIADDMALARRLHQRVAQHPELEAGTCGLSICTFRYVPTDLQAGVGTPEVEAHLDVLNRKLLDRLQTEGAAFVSNAVIRDRYMLRACIVNYNTGAGDVDALTGIVAESGGAIDREMRLEPLQA